MPAFDYTGPIQTANRLIERFGQAAKLRRPATSGTAYNPTQGSPADTDCSFVELERKVEEIEGSRTKRVKIKGLLAVEGLTSAPTLSDQLVLDATVVHAICDVKPLRPGGTVVLYELEIER